MFASRRGAAYDFLGRTSVDRAQALRERPPSITVGSQLPLFCPFSSSRTLLGRIGFCVLPPLIDRVLLRGGFSSLFLPYSQRCRLREGSRPVLVIVALLMGKMVGTTRVSLSSGKSLILQFV